MCKFNEDCDRDPCLFHYGGVYDPATVDGNMMRMLVTMAESYYCVLKTAEILPNLRIGETQKYAMQDAIAWALQQAPFLRHEHSIPNGKIVGSVSQSDREYRFSRG